MTPKPPLDYAPDPLVAQMSADRDALAGDRSTLAALMCGFGIGALVTCLIVLALGFGR